jgi:hypothetical protein
MWPVSQRVNKTGTGDDDPTLINEVAACMKRRAKSSPPALPSTTKIPTVPLADSLGRLRSFRS